MHAVTLPPINPHWSWKETNSSFPAPALPPISGSNSSSPDSSPDQLLPKKKTKRGRKPCANPTPQALRQRAYRLRKQMKKQQQQKEESQKLEEQLQSVVDNLRNKKYDALSDREHFVAEILTTLKSSVLVQ